MPARQIIALIVVTALVAAVLYVAIKHFVKPRKKSKRKSSASRQSDKRRLNRYERKAYDQALTLHRQGKSIPAAQLLESIGMMRESISVLESSGNIKEAAGTLLRMQKPNRAGVILARHKKWHEAAQCFMTAGLHLEAAKCFKEIGDFINAAENYSKAQRFEDAAECYYSKGDFSKAAKIFAKLNTREKYIDALQELYNSKRSLDQHPFDSNQTEIIHDFLINPENDFFPGFLSAFKASDQMADLLLELLENNRVKEASTAHTAFEAQCDDELLINVNYVKDQAPRLAKMFLDNEQYAKAAVVYSRLEEFENAGQCFEKAGDINSAISHYDKARNLEKVKELRKQSKGGKNSAPPPPRPSIKSASGKQTANPFSLESIESTGSNSKQNFEAEKTIIIDSEDQKNANFQVNKFEGDDDDTKVVFQRLEFLDELSRSEKDAVWAIGQERKFNKDQEILGLHEEPEGIIFVLRGQISIEISDHGKLTPIKVLESTESFGESWVLADQESPFKAGAKTDCHILIVSKDDLINLMNENGEIARKLYKKYTLSLLSKMVTPSHQRDKLAAS